MAVVNLAESVTLLPRDIVPDASYSPYQSKVAPGYRLPEGVEPVSEEEMANGSEVGTFLTRPYMSAEDRRASFQVTTAQGDKVTLTYERSEFRMDYLRPEGGYVPGLPMVHDVEDSFTMAVQGDLDEQELADIQAFRNAVHGALEGFLSRQTRGETIDDVDIAAYDALTEYAVALDTAGYISWAGDMVKGYVSQVFSDGPGQARPGQGTQSSRAAIPEPDIPPPQPTYPNPTAPAPVEKSGSDARSPAARLSRLGDITESVFEEISLSESDDARRDALDALSLRFSGLVEKLIDMFEENDRQENRVDNWV